MQHVQYVISLIAVLDEVRAAIPGDTVAMNKEFYRSVYHHESSVIQKDGIIVETLVEILPNKGLSYLGLARIVSGYIDLYIGQGFSLPPRICICR